MAASKNQSNTTSTAGLFGPSLEGQISFPQSSGPKLFTPIPVNNERTGTITQVLYKGKEPQSNIQSNNIFQPELQNLNQASIPPQQLNQQQLFQNPSPLITNNIPADSHDLYPLQNSTSNHIQQYQQDATPSHFQQTTSNNPYAATQNQLKASPLPVTNTQAYTNTKIPQFVSSPSNTSQISQPCHANPQLSYQHLSASNTHNAQTSSIPNSFSLSPVKHHWFFLKNSKQWIPFSYHDSNKLEYAFINKSIKVSTDGGRFDVDLKALEKVSIYWEEVPCPVRRCSWFHKGDSDSKLTPYSVDVAEKMENEYLSMLTKGVYNIKVDINAREFVIFHNPNVLVHYVSNASENIEWTGEDSKIRPKVVKRGIFEIADEIQIGESDEIDHLMFVVHGIGPVADIRMRSIVECVNDFRKNTLDLTLTHFPHNGKSTKRVEYLPIQWHSKLRNDRSDVDRQLESLSLPSIGKLRNFTNTTLTDILFFTSPTYCQAICDTVVDEMNKLFKLFKSRNPNYNGSVSLLGHSLGSCILFDILANQMAGNLDVSPVPIKTHDQDICRDDGETVDLVTEKQIRSSVVLSKNSPNKKLDLPDIRELLASLNLSNLQTMFIEEQIDTDTLMMCSETDLQDLHIPFGPRKKITAFIKEQKNKNESSEQPLEILSFSTRGTQTAVHVTEEDGEVGKGSVEGVGQVNVSYSKLEFATDSLFCLGSPLGLFLICRGIASLGLDYQLPTCRRFMNIFHPYDPVVYRLEPLINQRLNMPPVLIPHHKGRKRFHLELKENISRVSANLKSGFMDAMNRTWSSINDFARAHRGQEEILHPMEENAGNQTIDKQNSVDSFEEEVQQLTSVDYGSLNARRRVDYVLQEKPFEVLNEYLFALSSHTCYWTSEDTALLLLNEIYGDNK